MKIQSIHLKHILHFADLKVDFSYHDKPVTLILGDQASGKTSILRFSYQALTWFAARYKDLRSAGVVMLDHDIMLNRLQSKIDIQVAVPLSCMLSNLRQPILLPNPIHGNSTKP